MKKYVSMILMVAIVVTSVVIPNLNNVQKVKAAESITYSSRDLTVNGQKYDHYEDFLEAFGIADESEKVDLDEPTTYSYYNKNDEYISRCTYRQYLKDRKNGGCYDIPDDCVSVLYRTWVYVGYKADGTKVIIYNENGYDRCGYGRDGYNKEGYDRSGYGRDGYNRSGYDKEGYDRSGYGWDGYNKEGYDRNGYNKEGYDRNGYNKEGYDKNGYDREGYDRWGYDRDGYGRDGYNRSGYNRDGYDKEGYDRNGYDRDGYNKEGYSEKEKAEELARDYVNVEYNKSHSKVTSISFKDYKYEFVKNMSLAKKNVNTKGFGEYIVTVEFENGHVYRVSYVVYPLLADGGMLDRVEVYGAEQLICIRDGDGWIYNHHLGVKLVVSSKKYGEGKVYHESNRKLKKPRKDKLSGKKSAFNSYKIKSIKKGRYITYKLYFKINGKKYYGYTGTFKICADSVVAYDVN